jgi:HSP20 family protein
MSNSPAIKINPLPSPSVTKTKSDVPKEVGQLSLDIFKKGNELVLLAPIAGIKPDDVTISITDEVLVIKGTRVQKFEVSEEEYYTKECFWGRFSRSIVLPLEADAKNITANFDNHVLEIHIPLKEVETTKIIKIKS